MTSRFLFNILTLAFFGATSSVAYGQVSNNKSGDKIQIDKTAYLMYDTSKTAIIEFNKKSRWPFDSSFKAATLTQEQLQTVDSLFSVFVTDYNTSLDKDHRQWSIDLNKRNYRKQLITVINKDGQKEVWINCFCRIDNDKWKTRIFSVEDGGNCYFNFKINLTTMMYCDRSVNGV